MHTTKKPFTQYGKLMESSLKESLPLDGFLDQVQPIIANLRQCYPKLVVKTNTYRTEHEIQLQRSPVGDNFYLCFDTATEEYSCSSDGQTYSYATLEPIRKRFDFLIKKFWEVDKASNGNEVYMIFGNFHNGFDESADKPEQDLKEGLGTPVINREALISILEVAFGKAQDDLIGKYFDSEARELGLEPNQAWDSDSDRDEVLKSMLGYTHNTEFLHSLVNHAFTAIFIGLQNDLSPALEHALGRLYSPASHREIKEALISLLPSMVKSYL